MIVGLELVCLFLVLSRTLILAGQGYPGSGWLLVTIIFSWRGWINLSRKALAKS